MTLATSTVSQAVILARENKQLREQNERLVNTVKQQDEEIARNRETIRVQALRIQALEQQAHRTVDPAPRYRFVDEVTTDAGYGEATLYGQFSPRNNSPT